MRSVLLRIPARENERFTEEAAKSMVGQSFVAKREGSDELVVEGAGVVRAALVIEDGRFIEAMMDWPEGPCRNKTRSFVRAHCQTCKCAVRYETA